MTNPNGEFEKNIIQVNNNVYYMYANHLFKKITKSSFGFLSYILFSEHIINKNTWEYATDRPG